jgi:hypothetical protein
MSFVLLESAQWVGFMELSFVIFRPGAVDIEFW